jgi:hypothetical protein
MPYNQELTERIKITDRIFTSQCLTAGSKQTGTIDMGNFRRLVVLGAALGTTATTTSAHVTIKIIDSTAAGTATGTAIVKTTIACKTAGFPRYKILEITAEDVGKTRSVRTTLGRYVRVRVIYGTRGAQVALAVIGADARFEPHANTVVMP